MFLERYRRDRDPADLATARRLLAWVDDQAVVDSTGTVSWPFAGHAGAWTASGFELGVAGIAWVNLQAARTTGDAAYRARARRAGSWLRRVAVRGGAWEELPGDPGSPQHVGLDSGAAGIGWVLEDLARAGIDTAGEPRCRAHGARRAPQRGAPRPARGVLVREPDGNASTAARRAILALGRRRNRRVRGPARRLVRHARRAARGWPPATDKIGATPCARTRQPRRFASSRCTRLRARP